MVVFSHIVQQLQKYYENIQWISDWFNLGLVLFFVMSAFLYSKRCIKDKKVKWFVHRYIELIIPCLFTVLVTLTVFHIGYKNVDAGRIVNSILSGLGFEVFVSDSWVFIQYWFITYILVCYVTVPLIQKIDFKAMNEVSFWCIIIIATAVLQVVLSATGYISGFPMLSWGILLRFYLPYAMFRRYDDVSIRKPMIVLSGLALGCVFISCILRYFFSLEGMLSAITELFFIYTQTLAGTVLFYWLYRAFSYVQENNALIRIVDGYSFPVYLTHCLFIGYSTSVISRFNNHFVGILVALGCTVIASIITRGITSSLCRKIASWICVDL